MGLFSRLFGKKEIDANLIGKWAVDSDDKPSFEALGDAAMTFAADGKLTYEIREGDHLQIMNLVFWTEDGHIISDQPSHPRKERSRYAFENERVVVIEFQGMKTRFKKLEE